MRRSEARRGEANAQPHLEACSCDISRDMSLRKRLPVLVATRPTLPPVAAWTAPARPVPPAARAPMFAVSAGANAPRMRCCSRTGRRKARPSACSSWRVCVSIVSVFLFMKSST